MSDTEFVHVRHPDVTVPAVVARSALPYLTGWVVVDEPRRQAPQAPPVVVEPPVADDVVDVALEVGPASPVSDS